MYLGLELNFWRKLNLRVRFRVETKFFVGLGAVKPGCPSA